MLDDYFSLEIDDDGCLATLPMLLGDEFVPHLASLPVYIMRLATEVNWADEESCFHTLCKETARFYSLKEGGRYDGGQSSDSIDADETHWKSVVEHGVFGAAKRLLMPPKSMAEDMTFVQVADLPDLYKVFERC